MYAQLGSIIFDGLFSFDNVNVDGDEAVYAEFPLIGRKPRLQKTGDTLQELTLDIKLHAEFCNPAEQILAFKTAKEAGEVLPLLMGNGRYVADYVIVGMPYTTDEAFADGTIIQASVSLTIREYIAYNKLEQKEQEARKAAFAVGDKRQLALRPAQPAPLKTSMAANVTEGQQQATKIADQITEVENNPSGLQVAAKRIREASDKGIKAVSDLNQKLDDAQELKTQYTGLYSVATSVKTAFTAIKDLYPYDNISDLKSSNTYLQGVMRTFNQTSSPLLTDIIIRK